MTSGSLCNRVVELLFVSFWKGGVCQVSALQGFYFPLVISNYRGETLRVRVLFPTKLSPAGPSVVTSLLHLLTGILPSELSPLPCFDWCASWITFLGELSITVIALGSTVSQIWPDSFS